VVWLVGNVGDLDLCGIHEAQLAGATAAPAMRFLAHPAALIVGLRRNGDGDPGMLALLDSDVLRPEPVPLCDLHRREGRRVEQTGTRLDVPVRATSIGWSIS
jgi:hypothetical protein